MFSDQERRFFFAAASPSSKSVKGWHGAATGANGCKRR